MNRTHRKIRRAIRFGGAAILAGFVAAPTALAQSSATEETAGRSSEEIVVTARKREERLIDVPVAADVVSGAELTERGITGLDQLQAAAPELQITYVTSGTGGVMALRGVASSAIESGVENKVSLNIDGVSTSRGRLVQMGLFDLAGIEVLKGPQALYFGKNSTTGVVSLTSVDPGDEFEGYLTGGYETTAEEYSAEGAVSIPLGPGFGMRLAARATHMEEGYVRNVAGPITDPSQLPPTLALYGPDVTLPGRSFDWSPHSEDAAARLTLEYDQGGPFSANFKLFYGHREDTGPNGYAVPLGCGPGASAQTRFTVFVDPYGFCDIRRETSQGTLPAIVAAGMPGSNGGEAFSDLDAYLGSLTLDYEIVPNVTLTSVTGYQSTAFKSFVPGVELTTYSLTASASQEDFDAFSQEFRVHTDFRSPVNFSGGLYYETSERSEYAGSFNGYNGPDPVTGRTDLFANRFEQTGETYSAYGELTWDILPSLELAGGARYSHEEKTTWNFADYVHSAGLGFGFPPAGTVVRGELTSNNLSPQVTLSWHPTDDVLLYGAYKTGYLSGGFSAPPIIETANAANFQFNPEEVEGFEFGVKFSSLVDNRLSGSLTVFRYEYEGLQVNQVAAKANGVPGYFVANAGSATSQGVEADLNFDVTERLQLHGSAAFVESQYDSFPNAGCYGGQLTLGQGCVDPTPLQLFNGDTRQDLSGAPLPRAPKWVATLGASYEQPLFSSWSMGLDANVRYSSSYFTSLNNSPFNQEDGYVIFDASARLFSQDGLEFAIIGKNLADELYYAYGGDLDVLGGPPGATFVNPNPPRTVQIQVTKRF